MAGYQYQIPNGINSANGFAKRKYPLMTENFRKKFNAYPHIGDCLKKLPDGKK